MSEQTPTPVSLCCSKMRSVLGIFIPKQSLFQCIQKSKQKKSYWLFISIPATKCSDAVTSPV